MCLTFSQMLTDAIVVSFFFHSIFASSSSKACSFSDHGSWELLHESTGISAMHMQLMHDDKVVIFDRTDFGHSNISLAGGRCRYDNSDAALKRDCSAHSVLYDVDSNTFRPLTVQTDTWCSSGAVLGNGTLVQTGGFNDGERALRTFTPCRDNNCDWIEFHGYLSVRRWYATNQMLPDGRLIIVGGRRQFSYEFFPASSLFLLSFLRETSDEYENNLYPFVHLLPDGNLFIFANTRSILFDYNRNLVLKEFPVIFDRNPRNYPSSGSSVLLPLDENSAIEAEIMICGGARQDGYLQANQGRFISAIRTCGRLKVSDENPVWVMEEMPIPRVMGDMLLLPTGDIIIINGAESGTAGWENARSPATSPIIYRRSQLFNLTFVTMAASSRPRLYHSSAILLPDGRVLVGGSNPHIYYNFTGVQFPTDLSLEAFSPPYLSPEYDQVRPGIMFVNEVLDRGQVFSVVFSVAEFSAASIVSVRIVAPSFTTHSFAMNQRMVVLKINGVSQVSPDSFTVSVVGPSTAEIAPTGYYMLFVVHAGVPSSGKWVKVQ